MESTGQKSLEFTENRFSDPDEASTSLDHSPPQKKKKKLRKSKKISLLKKKRKALKTNKNRWLAPEVQ